MESEKTKRTQMSSEGRRGIRLFFASGVGIATIGLIIFPLIGIARAQGMPPSLPPGLSMPPGPPPNYVPPAPPNYVPGAPPPVQAPQIPAELLHPPVQPGNGSPTSPSASNPAGGVDTGAPSAPGYANYPPNQPYPSGQQGENNEATTQPPAQDNGGAPPATEEAAQPNPAPTPAQIAARPPELSGPLGATQEKINFPLLAASRTYRATPHDSASARMAMNIGGVSIDASGNTAVEIKATSPDAVLEKITSIGGSVTSASTNDGLIRARIPIDKVEDLAAIDSVKYVGAGSAGFGPPNFFAPRNMPIQKPTFATGGTGTPPIRVPYTSQGGATTSPGNE